MVDCPTLVLEVADLIPGRVIPKTLKMVVMAAILGPQGCGIAFRLTSWCLDKWTSRTCNLPKKRSDITEKLFKAA